MKSLVWVYRETVYFESEECIGGPTFCVKSRGMHHCNTVIQIFCNRIPANVAAIKLSFRENISFAWDMGFRRSLHH